MPKQVDPPGTDGIDVTLAIHVLQPNAFAAPNRQKGQPLVIFHLGGRVPQNFQVTAANFVIRRGILWGIFWGLLHALTTPQGAPSN